MQFTVVTEADLKPEIVSSLLNKEAESSSQCQILPTVAGELIMQDRVANVSQNSDTAKSRST